MQGQLHIIRPDNTVEQIERHELNAPPGLPALQEIVGGYIEMVPLMLNFVTKDGLKPCVVYCTETLPVIVGKYLKAIALAFIILYFTAQKDNNGERYGKIPTNIGPARDQKAGF